MLLGNHTQYVQRLLCTLAVMGPGQANVHRVLRATTCSPAAILTCLGRLFPEHGANRGGCAACAAHSVIVDGFVDGSQKRQLSFLTGLPLRSLHSAPPQALPAATVAAERWRNLS